MNRRLVGLLGPLAMVALAGMPGLTERRGRPAPPLPEPDPETPRPIGSDVRHFFAHGINGGLSPRAVEALEAAEARRARRNGLRARNDFRREEGIVRARLALGCTS